MNKNLSLLVVAFVTFCLSQGISQVAPAPNPKEALIVEILRASGGLDAFTPSIENFVQRYQRAFPELTSQEWDNIRTKMRSDLVQVTVKVWSANYSESDLRAFLEFYRSPAGQKLTRLNGKITQEITTESEGVGRDTDALIRWMAQKKQTSNQPESGMQTPPSALNPRSR